MKQKRMLGLCLGLAALLACGKLDAGDPESIRFFESKIRPALIAHCIECHREGRQEGGLRLDHAAGWEAGGDSGSLFEKLGDHQRPRVAEAIEYGQLQMPPDGQLPESVRTDLLRWIDQGAPWPSVAMKLDRRSEAWEEAAREHWLWKPMARAFPPEVDATDPACDHPIDAFVEVKRKERQLSAAPLADPRTLAKRLYLDLVGELPQLEEIESWLASPDESHYIAMVDRLLADPRYAERMGRYWLDLVRFAESDGYKQDDFRPSAYRYRDFVLEAFREDMPYADFVTWQLAGDEWQPGQIRGRDATGYLRLWIYEYNQRDVETQWSIILNDLTDVTGEVFLGLGIGCARCHDHKFDPILQKDYYRLQSCFAGLLPAELPTLAEDQCQAVESRRSEARQAMASKLAEQEALEQPIREEVRLAAIEKFPPEVRPALRKKFSERTPAEQAVGYLAELQIEAEVRGIDFKKKLKGESLDRWKALEEELEAWRKGMPPSVPTVATVREVGPVPPPTRIPGARGEAAEAIEPGALAILNESPWELDSRSGDQSSGRRLALARWIVDRSNRLSWRVMVNRIWQHHFGAGLVENASDFGRLTQPPSHPELLDWLAAWFQEREGSWKQLSRLIVTSHTYRQAAYFEGMQEAFAVDPANRWLWRFSPRRMDAEQARDTILSLAGVQQRRWGGPSVDAKSTRRSVYRRAMRNSPDSFLRALDAPDGIVSVAKRMPTNTPLQALQWLNSPWMVEQSVRMAEQLAHLEGEAPREAFRRVHLREPEPSELEVLRSFMSEPGATLDQLCHTLLSSNALLYIE